MKVQSTTAILRYRVVLSNSHSQIFCTITSARHGRMNYQCFSMALSNVLFECLQAKALETRESYVFRVRAVNTSGIGMASTPSDPVCIKALPGKPVL